RRLHRSSAVDPRLWPIVSSIPTTVWSARNCPHLRTLNGRGAGLSEIRCPWSRLGRIRLDATRLCPPRSPRWYSYYVASDPTRARERSQSECRRETLL